MYFELKCHCSLPLLCVASAILLLFVQEMTAIAEFVYPLVHQVLRSFFDIVNPSFPPKCF